MLFQSMLQLYGTLGLEQKLTQLREFKDEQLVTSLEITTGTQVQQQ